LAIPGAPDTFAETYLALPPSVAVPNVVGLTQAALTTAITGAGLVVGTVTTASSSTVAAGNVISESPAAGTPVNAGSAVNLVVSSGPPPDFSLTANSAISVNVGGSVASAVTVSPLYGFSSVVGLNVSGAPSGVSALLDPTSVTPSGSSSSSTLTVSLSPLVTPNGFTLNVTGASGALTHSVRVGVNVSATNSSVANVIGSLLAAGCIDNSGIAYALTSKLSAAQGFIAAGDSQDAINALNALLNQISAQSGKHIEASCTSGGQTFNPATVLTVDVQRLIDSLQVGAIADPITGYVVSSSNTGISGVTVSILNGATIVATATTDVTGFYYFPATNVLAANTSYTIEVNPIPSPLSTSTPPASTFTWTGSSGLTFTFTLN
jgi:hypothetical protein